MEENELTTPEVSIIIASYNGKHFLEKSIPSILNSSFKNYEIIVYDDASTDSTQAYINSVSNSHIKYFRNDQNQGAAKTRNNATSKALAPIIIFLDNDTEVDSGWIEPVVNILKTDSSIGAVQSTLIDYHKRDTIQLAGIELIPHVCWGIPLLQGESIAHNFSASRDIVALSAAMAVRKEVVNKVEGFDEKLAVYTEDLEFSLRIWIAGYRIVNSPESHVFHWTKKIEDRKSMNSTRQGIYFHLTKNCLRTLIKNYSYSSLLKYLPWAIIILSARIPIRLLRNDTSALFGTIKGFWWTIANLSDTVYARNKVQKQLRKTSDAEIMQKVFTKKSLKEIYQKHFS